jgi:hypothetical protein
MGDPNVAMVIVNLALATCASVFTARLAQAPRFHKFPNLAFVLVLAAGGLLLWTTTLYAAVGFRSKLISSVNDGGRLVPTAFCKFQGMGSPKVPVSAWKPLMSPAPHYTRSMSAYTSFLGAGQWMTAGGCVSSPTPCGARR